MMVPLMRPFVDWYENKAPAWLRGDVSLTRTAGRLCGAPRTPSMRTQPRGHKRGGGGTAGSKAAGGGVVAVPGLPHVPEGEAAANGAPRANGAAVAPAGAEAV